MKKSSVKDLRKKIEELAEEMILAYEVQARNIPIVPADRSKWLYNVWIKHVVALFKSEIDKIIGKDEGSLYKPSNVTVVTPEMDIRNQLRQEQRKKLK